MITAHDLIAWFTPSRHTLSLLSPDFPNGYDAWDGFYTILLLTLFKLRRGQRMQQRAVYIDRFGWAIILFDYVFGLVFFTSLLFTFYPGLHVSIWIDRILLNWLFLMTLWQLVEIETADTERVQIAMGGTEEPPHPPYSGPERRAVVRREDDREKDARLAKYEGTNP